MMEYHLFLSVLGQTSPRVWRCIVYPEVSKIMCTIPPAKQIHRIYNANSNVTTAEVNDSNEQKSRLVQEWHNISHMLLTQQCCNLAKIIMADKNNSTVYVPLNTLYVIWGQFYRSHHIWLFTFTSLYKNIKHKHTYCLKLFQYSLNRRVSIYMR